MEPPRAIGTVPYVGGWVWHPPSRRRYRVTQIRARDRRALRISGGSDLHAVSGIGHTGFQFHECYPCEAPDA